MLVMRLYVQREVEVDSLGFECGRGVGGVLCTAEKWLFCVVGFIYNRCFN